MEDWKKELETSIEKIVDSCKLSVCPSKKASHPVRVKIDDSYFMSPKGKMIWPGIGPAKNALRMHILDMSVYRFWNRNLNVDYKEFQNYKEELFKRLLERVVFEPV